MRGLHTYASDISGVPSGSLAVAQNININRQGIAEPRRGFGILTYSLPLVADRIKKLMFWNDGLYAHYGSTFAFYDEAIGFQSRGSLVAPSGSSWVRSLASQNKNLYVTSDEGIQKIDSSATSLYAAGIPKGLNIDLSLTGAGSALSNNAYATYRYLLGRKDANLVTSFGGVSGRFTIRNTAGSTQNITVRCYLPSGLDTSYFIQLYKCPESTAAATTDELQQCYETPITSTDISNGYIDIGDIVPDALLGATIYTSPNQQGLVNDNARPPLARDMAEYKNCTFYADIESVQRLAFSLIAVSGTGLVATDTITISDGTTTEVYTGHASVFDSSIKQFVVSTGGSSSQNIDATIKSFIKCVNLASTIVTAFSMTEGATDLPGKILLEGKTLGAAAFTAVSSRSVAFQPQLTSPASVNNTSANDTFKNGLMFSKPGQSEAVPLKNIFKVGSSDDRIKRIVPLRDGLFIFKERDGLSVLRGEGETTFAVTVLDATAKILAPESLQVVNNLIYGLFEAGICEVSDTGVSIISIPIKDQLQPLQGDALANVKALTWACGIDTDGKYFLSVPLSATDTSTTKQFVYDTFGQTYCVWTLNASYGAINPTDSKVYLGSGDANTVKQERKAFDYTDAADFHATCTISSYSGTTVFINNTSGMTPGDVLTQGLTAIAYIETVDAVSGSITIDTEQAWTLNTADVTHEKAIDCKIQWNPDAGGNAAGLKNYYECVIVQKQTFQKEATVYFSSDVNPAESSISIESASGNGAWGMFDFGDEVFGGEQANAPRRIGVPRGHARCSQLSVRFENKIAFSDFQVTGLSLSFSPTSTRTSR